MDISMESFHVADAKRGALVRRRSPREVRTLAVFRTDDGLHHVETALTHPGDLLAWTSYTMRSGDEHLDVVRDGGSVEVGGERVTVPDDTLPSHVATTYLEDMLAQSATEAEFHRLDEQAPSAPPAPAHFSVSNPEEVELPDGRREELGAADLYVGEDATQRFWFDSHDILAADWHGARSYRVETVDELVYVLDSEVAGIVRAFCG